MNFNILFFCFANFVTMIFAQKFPIILNPRHFRTPPLSCEDIKLIVDFHNNARRLIANGTLPGQPKAVNMQKISWDPMLAEVATNWTKKMIFAHNPDRKDRRFSVGENLYMTASTNVKKITVEWLRPLYGWFNEYTQYTFEPVFDDPITGHYTQMIWHDVIYVGCSTTQFYDARNWLYKYYVCNYGPAGNWYGDFPYTEDTGLIEKINFLISIGLLPSDIDIESYTCDKLCCEHNQCENIYGPKCPSQ